MIETILADMILSVFSGIYYHILCVEHGRQGKKLAACVLSLIALNLVIDVLFLTPTAANNLITFILTSAFILFWIPWLYNVPKGRILLYVMIQYGILLLVSVPLVIVVPNLMLVPGLVFGTLIKVIVYVIACPICLRLVSHDVRNHQLTMQILRNKGEDQRAQEYANKIERKITDALK